MLVVAKQENKKHWKTGVPENSVQWRNVKLQQNSQLAQKTRRRDSCGVQCI